MTLDFSPVTLQEDNEVTCLNDSKKIKTVNLKFYTWQKYCSKTNIKEDVYRHIQAKRIHYSQIYTTRNVKVFQTKESYVRLNLDLHKTMKNTRNDNSMVDT